MFNNRIVIEPEGLLSIEGLEGIDVFPLAECFLDKKAVGKVKLIHATGEISAPSYSSMIETARHYKNGSKLKIKGREFFTSCATLYLTESGKWSLEVCVKPIEMKGSVCHCVDIFNFNFSDGE